MQALVKPHGTVTNSDSSGLAVHMHIFSQIL